MIDYDIYNMTKNEKIKEFLKAYVVMFLISYLFYANALISILFSFSAYYYLGVKRKEIIKKRKKKLLMEFKDAIYLLSSSLGVGYSVQNAFKKTAEGLRNLYGNVETYIVIEFDYISKQIDLNKDINGLLLGLSKRANIEDISNFVDVFIICRNTGGNLNEVIRNTSKIINDKIDIEGEIEVLITQKKLEQKVISIIPICIMAMLSFTASTYIEPLHSNIYGYIVVTIALFMIIISTLVAKKIMQIDV